jgi:AcrR family transcriptional regulator
VVQMGRKPVRDKRRKQILEAVHACLLEKSFHKTSIKDIAQKAGLNHGAVHYYFKNKEDLLLEYIDYSKTKFDNMFMKRFKTEIQKPTTDIQTFHRKIRLVLHEMSFNEEYARAYTEIWAHAIYNQKVMDKLKYNYRDWQEQLFEEVKNFVESKKLAQQISLTIIALCEGMSLMAIFFNQKDLNSEIDFGKFLQILTPRDALRQEVSAQ